MVFPANIVLLSRRALAESGAVALLAATFIALALAGTDASARGSGHGGGHSGHSGSRSGSHHSHHGAHRARRPSSSVFYGSYWAFPAYWYTQAAPAYLPREPVYYIERSEEELGSSSAWYYCEGAGAYYPYVSKCPAGWVKVEPFDLP